MNIKANYEITEKRHMSGESALYSGVGNEVAYNALQYCDSECQDGLLFSLIMSQFEK